MNNSENHLEDNTVPQGNGGDASRPVMDDQHFASPNEFDNGNWERDNDPYEKEEIAATDWPFKCLGHDHGNYFFIAKGANQIVPLRANGLNKANFLTLAPLDWWYAQFPREEGEGEKKKVTGIKWDSASDTIIRMCHEAGVFNPDERQRGAGVWKEKRGPLIHCGNKLIYLNGEYEAFSFESYYIYESAPKRFDLHPDALTDVEAKKLYNICIGPSWKNENSGRILAGWIVIAIICGCLDWRPHIWLMGPLGSGKSFIINDILKPIMVGIGKFLGAGSTEAGVRQSIKNDALPVIMDEMEGESIRDNEVLQSILAMSRRSSSGQTMAKGSADGIAQNFNLMSAFCFASINHGIAHGADASRISILEIEPDKRPDAAQKFEDLDMFARETLTPEYSRRLVRRTINNLPVILKNIKTFQTAVRKKFGNSRSAQQLAPLLAGVYSLLSSEIVTPEQADKWLIANDLEGYTANDAQKDNEKLFEFMMTTKIRVTGGSKVFETQIGTAICIAMGIGEQGYNTKEAQIALETIDIKVRESAGQKPPIIWIKSTSQHINKILRGQPWAASWCKALQLNSFVSLKKGCRIGTSSCVALVIDPDKFNNVGE